MLSALSSLPMTRDTILCGDFNARLGPLTGDAISNARGNALKPWLSVLNASLAFGVKTYSSFRQQQEMSSIIDLFLTNIGDVAFLNAQPVVESDLSLGSDHRLMLLTFEYVPPPDNTVASGDSVLAPRRQWKLSKVTKEKPLGLLRESFRSSVGPLVGTLSGLVSAPPAVRPDIDALNDSLNQCLYESLDSSIGVKSGRPGHWKKYWTQEIQDAATARARSYSQWRHAFATAAIKRNKESSPTYNHADGPAASVSAMGSHLASVYDGSLLATATRPVVAFLDIKSAYDTVDRRVIWSALADSSLPRAVLSLLMNLFDDEVEDKITNMTKVLWTPPLLNGLKPSVYINRLTLLAFCELDGPSQCFVPSK